MTIERRPFGRTGHMSSAVIFGSAALKAADQGVADRVLDVLIEYGVNHIDSAPRYGRRRAPDRTVHGPAPR
jgi:aryl-alcohol dehydrogenase-like predicted oxidoreductase